MATHTTAQPGINELRFIGRLNPTTLPSEYPFGVVSTTAGSSSAVEGSDVFVVGGQTRSKFYSSERFIDDTRVSSYRLEGFIPLLTYISNASIVEKTCTYACCLTLDRTRPPLAGPSSVTSTPTTRAIRPICTFI